MEAITGIRAQLEEVVSRYGQHGDRVTAGHLIRALVDPDGVRHEDESVAHALAVTSFAVRAAVDGNKKDRTLLAQFAKRLASVVGRRALAVLMGEDAIGLYHAPAATARQRDEAIRMLAIGLPSFCDRRFQSLSIKSIRAHLSRTEPQSRVGSGAGHIGAPGMVAALSVDAGAFGDGRRRVGSRRETLAEARARVAKAFRIAASRKRASG